MMLAKIKHASVLLSVLFSSSVLISAFAPSRSILKSLPRTETEIFSNSIQDEEVSPSTEAPVVPETASILPGQVVSIRIGDMSNPRKAWKKRRRTGSPILVPCTILGLNKEMMVKFNLINLLHRFGKPQEHDSRNGVVLSVGAAVKLYKHRLGGDLLKHANALGYDTIVKMLKGIFDDSSFRDTGVQVTRTGTKRELVLSSSLSLRLARESAFKAEFIQFCSDDNKPDRMVHTGTTFQLEKDGKYKTLTSPDVIQPLSAAVRISQKDAESGRFQAGMECNAFFNSYDGKGDNGSPLVTCAIDPPRGQIRDQMKRRAYVKRQVDAKTSEMGTAKPGLDLNEINIGDGPITATVVRVSSSVGAAFVDLGVTRNRGKKSGGGTVKVLGMLRFDDIVENMADNDNSDEEAALIKASILEGSDEEEEDDDDIMTVEDLFMNEEVEDVSNLYSMDEDGNVLTTDPSTGEKTVIGSVDSDEDTDDDDEDDNMFAGMSPEERLGAIGDMLAKEEAPQDQFDNKERNDAKVDTELKEGDKVNVYVRSVFLQSGRFMVTLDASMKGRKMKDLKREKQADKRLTKLSKKLGGEEGMTNILSSIGLELEGVVKAKSKTGDWYYVQPDVDGFPVGIAKSESGISLEPGQRAKVRVDGIDESRGQLALTVLESLE